MSETSQLNRIEGKLDGMGGEIAEIKAALASDLQRFERIDDRFVETQRKAETDLQLHSANCTVKQQVGKLTSRMDAADNKLKGARWAGGRLWATVVAILVLVDMGVKVYQAIKH